MMHHVKVYMKFNYVNKPKGQGGLKGATYNAGKKPMQFSLLAQHIILALTEFYEDATDIDIEELLNEIHLLGASLKEWSISPKPEEEE